MLLFFINFSFFFFHFFFIFHLFIYSFIFFYFFFSDSNLGPSGIKKNILGSQKAASTSNNENNEDKKESNNDFKGNCLLLQNVEENVLTIPLTKPSFVQPESDRLRREKKNLKDGSKNLSVGAYREKFDEKKEKNATKGNLSSFLFCFVFVLFCFALLCFVFFCFDLKLV